jgi:putative flavoprotein involved in K+ transport
MEFSGNPDAFVHKDEVADYFVAYAKKVAAPIRCGIEVTRVERNVGRSGFRVETSAGMLEAQYVVAATGPFQVPVIPPLVPETAGIAQLHSASYRNPRQLPGGAVLVVGAGSSGVQIADELSRAGRRVYLSVSTHDRPPRSYRGRDFCWWLGVLDKWDAEATAGIEHTTIAVSGAYGGRTIDFRRLARQGMTLVGRTEAFENGVMRFAADLAANIERGDANYLSLLDEADAFVARNGLALPEEPKARELLPMPACASHPILSLDLEQADIGSIIWATGYCVDYGWLKVDGVDENGRPRHQRGVSSEPGVYFLGLPWQTRRGSAFIWGVWYDAEYIADHITRRRRYLAYAPSPERQTKTA